MTATFVKETGIDVLKPAAITAVLKPQGKILIAIDDKNEIHIDKNEVELHNIGSIIERLHAENPKGTVVIQADKKSNTDIVLKVMLAAKAAGVSDIAIAAER